MTALFKKLNYKGQATIFVLHSPDSFEEELAEMQEFTQVDIEKTITAESEIHFAIVFVAKQTEIDEAIAEIYPKLQGDAILWFCYPKGSSKKYKCDFNRDTGWESVGKCSLEGVRMVAIDEDWSALRFRKTEYIKVIKRSESFALSEEGKKRAKKAKEEKN
ncbi:MAG: hypothetical protein ACKVTZ_23975 [Bacteroidia bacterium]